MIEKCKLCGAKMKEGVPTIHNKDKLNPYRANFEGKGILVWHERNAPRSEPKETGDKILMDAAEEQAELISDCYCVQVEIVDAKYLERKEHPNSIHVDQTALQALVKEKGVEDEAA